MADEAPALLIVDDTEVNRDVLAGRLGRLGYTDLTMAADGVEALEMIARRPFDLVLLDIMMPRMNGYEVLERLRGQGRLAGLPVVVVSALAEMDSVVKCIELGAEDYLTKPINSTLLRARVGACLEKKRLRDEVVRALARLERELTAARDIQLSMVPADFPVATAEQPIEVAAALQPARQVGGDLYDVFRREDGSLWLAVADVSDKGAPAALFMARAKALLRLAATLERTPAGAAAGPSEIMARLNGELCRDNPHAMFVTLLLGALHDGGRLVYCSAGHPAPYVLGDEGDVRPLLGARGKPLGVRPGQVYEAAEATLGPAETLVAFTDGITEAMDGAGELFGEDRLEAALRGRAGVPPRALVDGVLAAVQAFAGGTAQSDDIALLALRRLA